MGPITREIVQQGLLDYLTILGLVGLVKEKGSQTERGIAAIEPQDIANLFSQEEYMRLYQANAGVLASMLQSPEKRKRELAYTISGAHLRMKIEYGQREMRTS